MGGIVLLWGPNGDIPDETSVCPWPLPPVRYPVVRVGIFPWLWTLPNCELFSCLTGSEADKANSVTLVAPPGAVYICTGLYIQGILRTRPCECCFDAYFIFLQKKYDIPV